MSSLDGGALPAHHDRAPWARPTAPVKTRPQCTSAQQCPAQRVSHQLTTDDPRDLQEGWTMTPDTPRRGTPAPHAPRQGKPARRWPDPGTPSGAVLYAVIAGLIVWIIISILSHVHVLISWH